MVKGNEENEHFMPPQTDAEVINWWINFKYLFILIGLQRRLQQYNPPGPDWLIELHDQNMSLEPSAYKENDWSLWHADSQLL